MEGEDIIRNGLVITDLEGNEFVWIPVTDANKYVTNIEFEYKKVSEKTQNDLGYLPLKDIEIGIESETGEDQKRQLTFEKEKELVTQEGIKGFYVSRYEAGKETNDGVDTLVSKKDASVWTNIAQETAKGTAKTFINNEHVKSALITGIQWDMVMDFIGENRKDGKGEDYIVTQASNPASNRHRSSGGVQQSGRNEYDRVCNIYDLEGNCWEYVAERNKYNEQESSYIGRGGGYGNSAPAAYRYNRTGNMDGGSSFRFVLYVM